MSRYYETLECGCLVSCDGSGGLIPVCHNYGEETPKTCKVPEYLKAHDIKYGQCKICHPIAYKQAIEEFGDYTEVGGEI